MLALWYNGAEIAVKQWKFPCGEVGVKLEDPASMLGRKTIIQLHWEGNDDLIALGQLVDIVRRKGVKDYCLYIPYFPYSRQDRRCMPGEAHSLKMVAEYINSLGFRWVSTLDAHSPVLEAVVDRLHVKSQQECAFNLPVYDYLIAPDAGAAKKVEQHAQVRMGNTNVIFASKTRSEGSMVVRLPSGYLTALAGKRVCVVDDLCDGGATFTNLAKLLVIPGFDAPTCLDLYVTHGFFTKGVDVLLERYDTIYTNNLMRPEFRGQVKEI